MSAERPTGVQEQDLQRPRRERPYHPFIAGDKMAISVFEAAVQAHMDATAEPSLNASEETRIFQRDRITERRTLVRTLESVYPLGTLNSQGGLDRGTSWLQEVKTEAKARKDDPEEELTWTPTWNK